MAVEAPVLVLGDGGWGTALALALHRAGREVCVWSVDPDYAGEVRRSRENPRFLPGVRIPEAIGWTADRDEAVEGAGLVLSVVPTQFLRRVLEGFGARLGGRPVVSATKGLERGTLRRPSEILREFLPEEPVAVLSGPSHAEEVAHELATSVVVASEDEGFAREVQEAWSSPSFRIYTRRDLAGVELGGALKNVIAVAAGIVDGLGLGDNAKAALVSRGLVEMARFGAAEGAERETFFGLSGAGDLIVTCYSRHSRNRAVGERIGGGETLEAILASTGKVAEGVWTCEALHTAARQRGLELPITAALYAVLFEGHSPAEACRALMERPARPEEEGL